jgi:acyl CoA:acetate/3-ketoacid CoA transferase
MAKAATLTIVEAENIVPIGSIDPNDVDLPGIFVDRIVPATDEKHIEIKKLRESETGSSDRSVKDAAQIERERIGRRAAKELKQGYYVNLGVGEYQILDLQERLSGRLIENRYSDARTFVFAKGRQGVDSIGEWYFGHGTFPGRVTQSVRGLIQTGRISHRGRG